MYDQNVAAQHTPPRENPQDVHSPQNARGSGIRPSTSHRILSIARLLMILVCLVDVGWGIRWLVGGECLLAILTLPGLLIAAAMAIVFDRVRDLV